MRVFGVNNRTITRRLTVGFIAVLVLGGAAAFVGLWSMRGMSRTIGLTLSDVRADAQLAATLSSNIAQVMSAGSRYTAWVARFGVPECVSLEDYGRATSVRVRYANGLEVELSITDDRWASAPIDPGTAEVARNGVVVVSDRDGDATALAEAIGAFRRIQ